MIFLKISFPVTHVNIRGQRLKRTRPNCLWRQRSHLISQYSNFFKLVLFLTWILGGNRYGKHSKIWSFLYYRVIKLPFIPWDLLSPLKSFADLTQAHMDLSRYRRHLPTVDTTHSIGGLVTILTLQPLKLGLSKFLKLNLQFDFFKFCKHSFTVF